MAAVMECSFLLFFSKEKLCWGLARVQLGIPENLRSSIRIVQRVRAHGVDIAEEALQWVVEKERSAAAEGYCGLRDEEAPPGETCVVVGVGLDAARSRLYFDCMDASLSPEIGRRSRGLLWFSG
jgi:hypothetical protein